MSIPTAHARRRHAPAAHPVADRTPGSAPRGTIYLLHFSEPYKHARHYLGWTSGPLEHRLAGHAAGRGARLLAVVRSANITWSLARTRPGSRTRERSLKRRGGSSRHCPMCEVTPRSLADRDTVADLPNRYPAYAAGRALGGNRS
jgi:predicted GIY-YIG superfamily endonuclease